MSQLLKKIQAFDPRAAGVLKDADLRTDSDLRSLTREDLRDLFPEGKDFKLRRSIFDNINSRKPADAVLRELKDLIPNEALRESLSVNGPLLDYLRLLKDLRCYVSDVQDFIEAHINLLEESREDKPQQESDKGCSSGASNSSIHGPQEHHSRHTHSQPRASMKYKKVVSGKTLGADEQLMDKVKRGLQDRVQLVETSDDHEVTLLFCPISSRLGTDVDAAMTRLNDDKPVILVLMHHTYEPTSRSMTSRIDDAKVVLEVSIFFHDSKSGLLTCQHNDANVQIIQRTLLELKGSSSGASNSDTHGPQQTQSGLQTVSSWSHQPRVSLKYKKFVSGKALGADEQLMDKVKCGLQDRVQLVETSDDYEVTLLFCPISSRTRVDVEAAMTRLNDDKPVILVLMHHRYEATSRSMPSRIDDAKVVLEVSVFFHDTKSGLLTCQHNVAAAESIQRKLLELKGVCVSARNGGTSSSNTFSELFSKHFSRLW